MAMDCLFFLLCSDESNNVRNSATLLQGSGFLGGEAEWVEGCVEVSVSFDSQKLGSSYAVKRRTCNSPAMETEE